MAAASRSAKTEPKPRNVSARIVVSDRDAAKPRKANRPRCGVTTRAGTPCKRQRGAGTDHVGFGHCANHGGLTQSGKLHASKERVEAVKTLHREQIGGRQAIEVVLSDDYAILRAVRSEVEKLLTDEVVRHDDLHPLVRLLQEVGQRLAITGKLAADAGIDERRVAVDEQIAVAVAQVIRATLTDLGVPLDERAHQVIALRLAEVQMAA